MMLCMCGTHFKSEDQGGAGAVAPHQNVARVLSAKLRDGELKLLQGSIGEAEALLREALSLNNEEARALLGRLEYDRGNYEKALQNLQEIQAVTLVPSLRFFVADTKSGKKKARHLKDNKDRVADSFVHGASLLLEALFLKAKCLQELGRHSDAARECKLVLDTMEAATPGGLPEDWGKTRVADMLSSSVKLLPEILLEMDRPKDAMYAYRRSLLRFSWCLSASDLVHVMKSFAVLLLYGGVEAPRATALVEGAFTPKDNTEEGVLLLLILLRIMNKEQGFFDASVFEHLSFVLSTTGQLELLAHQYEALQPGTLSRPERWYSLALCYAGDTATALPLLRKGLAQVPHDVPMLLLAAKLCVSSRELHSEGVRYAKRALVHLPQRGSSAYRARALHIQGVVLRSDSKALETLQEAASLDRGDTSIIFDLGLAYLEQRHPGAALECAKRCFDRGWGAAGGHVHGWRFLALALCAQELHAEADQVLQSALEDSCERERTPLLRTRAKVQLALGQPLPAVQSYRLLLGLLQAEQRGAKVAERVEEVEVWHDLAELYIQLKQWADAETCLEKARLLESYSAATWHITGVLREEQGQLQEAIVCFQSALAIDPSSADTKLKLGALLWQAHGASSLALAKTYLTSALEAEPHHQEACYQLGMMHKAEGRRREAAACFQAALEGEQSSPLEKFSSITPALLWH